LPAQSKVTPRLGSRGDNSNLPNAALAYAARGWRVLPLWWTEKGRCACGDPKCESPGKHPIAKLVPHGVKDATSDPEIICKWWRECPKANIGIATGNGLVVLDVDNPEALKGRHLPPTPVVRTGRGHHYYFKAPPGVRAARLEGVGDLKADGGYVVAPPSVHASGTRYEWAIAPDEEELAPLPEWVFEFTKRAPQTEPEGRKIKAGTRNVTLASIAGTLRRRGLGFEAIHEALKAINELACDPPLDPREVERIARSISRYEAKGPEAPHVWSATELMAADIPERRWVIPGLLPEGLALLAGRPKIGKSWLALGLAVAVALGSKALGEVEAPRGGVLYLALEDSPHRLRERLRTLLGDQAPPRGLHLATSWEPLPEGLEVLRDWLSEHPDVRLVIVDTLARIRRPGSKRGDSYLEDYEALAGLADLARKEELCILVLHHLRKTESTDPLALVLGSTALTGAADTVLVLRRARGEADAELLVVGRDIEDRELALRFQGGRWASLGDAAEWRLSRERREILQVLEDLGGEASPKEIAEVLEKPQGTVRKLLHHMVRDGEVVRVRKGRYAIPPAGKSEGNGNTGHIGHTGHGGNKGNGGNAGNAGNGTALPLPRSGGNALFSPPEAKKRESVTVVTGDSIDPDDPATWSRCPGCGRLGPWRGYCPDCRAAGLDKEEDVLWL